jgi:glycosyltransferase involved in cell wall biosynthesis
MPSDIPPADRSVDVVIPCYNYARFLERCVQSVLTQERVQVRVLIIDDASTDETPAVGAELAADPRVEFRRHARNMRHIATYNEGLIGWASAKYSLLLSADDWLAPGALGRSVDFLESHPAAGLVCGHALIVEDDAQAAAPPPLDGKWCVLSGEDFTRHCVSIANPVSTPTAVVRTGLQQQIGGYRPELPHSGDMEMWMRFAAHGAVGIIRDVQAYYRWHGQNMGREY